MEIKSVFTEEAKQLLEEESKQLRRELRKAAISEALQSRGEPVEVTTSDVRRARSFIIMRHEYPVTSMADLLLKTYGLLGAILLISGLLLPYVRRFLEESDPFLRISFLTVIIGLMLIFFSFFGRNYIKLLNKRRVKRKDEMEEDENSGPKSHNRY